MVKTRFSVDSETKMPVESGSSRRRPVEDKDSVSSSAKDHCEISGNSQDIRRELRDRGIPNTKRLTNNAMRSKRGRRLVYQNHTSTPSHSEDEGEEQDATNSTERNHPGTRRKVNGVPNRVAVDGRKVKSTIQGLNVGASTSRVSTRDRGKEAAGGSGIRRSTRKRKLKYENYSDSWIVGAQALIGYPNYGKNYAAKGQTKASMKGGYDEAEEGESADDYEEVDDEEEGKGDESEEEDRIEENGVPADANGDEGDNNREEETVAADNTADAQEAQGRRGRRKRSCRELAEENTAAGQENSNQEAGFEDMYSRVKRPRTRRVQSCDKTAKKRRKTRGASSSSIETSSEDRNADGTRDRAQKYHLREKVQIVKRFASDDFEPRMRSMRRGFRSSPGRCRSRSMRHTRRRSTSSCSSLSTSAERYDCAKSTADRPRRVAAGDKEVARGSRAGAGSGVAASNTRSTGRLADLDPITLDTSIRFSDVGGLESHVRCLQEMVVFPMLYSEVFSKFHITLPKGVLFHGPPGTGKTLIARALANECSTGSRKVSFFMRKGADCLSKWVGESERQLRLLFEQAHQSRPSIIFFDEIDGLAPVRSSKQDQIHASIVSTLLALMDGLDNRGDIIVIGATNRIDAIDPALRRPGRFDRELLFPLPGSQERAEILKIHTSRWESKPSEDQITKLADASVGFCGSDLRALCSEAVINALGRRYPQIYKSSQKLLIDPDCVQVEPCDFNAARKEIVPASYRSAPAVARKLPVFLEPLLTRALDELVAHLKVAFPSGFVKSSKSLQVIKSPRLLIIGQNKQTTLLSAAVLYNMDQCPVHVLDLAVLFCQSSRSPEEACIQIFNEVRRTTPSILYLPGVGEWWDTAGTTVQAVFLSMINQIDPCLPILLLATAQSSLPLQLENAFSVYRNEIYLVPSTPTDEERRAFFHPLIMVRAVRPKLKPKCVEEEEQLPLAPPPSPPKLTEEELRAMYDVEEDTLRELRIFLRQTCTKLARNKEFYMFSKPVDVAEVPDYLGIIKEPMDLEKIMTKIDQHKYECSEDFLKDVELMCSNALEYNPDFSPADKQIRHRACSLRDIAYSLIRNELETDFDDECKKIRTSRQDRAAAPDRSAPDFVWTASNAPQPQTAGASCSSSSSRNTASNNNQIESSKVTSAGRPSKAGSSGNGQSLRKRKRGSLWQRGLIRKPSRSTVTNLDCSQNESTKNENSKTETVMNKKTSQSCEQSDADAVVVNGSCSPVQLDPASQQPNQADIQEAELPVDLPVGCSTPVKRKRLNTQSTSGEAVSSLECVQASNLCPIVNGVSNSEEMLSDVNELSNGEEETLDDGDGDLKLDNSFTTTAIDSFETTDVNASRDTVQVSRYALEQMLEEVVNVTQGVSSLELLLDLYAQLRCVVNKHLRTNIRHNLPSDLEQEIRRFASQRSVVDMDFRQDGNLPGPSSSTASLMLPSSEHSLATHSHNTRHKPSSSSAM